MTEERKTQYEGDEEVIQRNIERSREVIEMKKHAEDAGKATPPSPSDPRSKDEAAAPRQWDVPIEQSSPNARGGSSKRQKPN